mmetsp:Transcript_80929/g.249719  ORF Transcript_80929/g.249719 Transcript_80929/m.249719 type:complete len:283 (+) Transcript_80929:741-1589(+)
MKQVLRAGCCKREPTVGPIVLLPDLLDLLLGQLGHADVAYLHQAHPNTHTLLQQERLHALDPVHVRSVLVEFPGNVPPDGTHPHLFTGVIPKLHEDVVQRGAPALVDGIEEGEPVAACGREHGALELEALLPAGGVHEVVEGRAPLHVGQGRVRPGLEEGLDQLPGSVRAGTVQRRLAIHVHQRRICTGRQQCLGHPHDRRRLELRGLLAAAKQAEAEPGSLLGGRLRDLLVETDDPVQRALSGQRARVERRCVRLRDERRNLRLQAAEPVGVDRGEAHAQG